MLSVRRTYLLSISQFLLLILTFVFSHPQDEFPQLLTDDVYQRHFKIFENRRNRGVALKSFEVYNKMGCIHQCTRFSALCVSVNFKKMHKNGMYGCELLNNQETASTDFHESFDFITMQVSSHRYL